MKKLFILLTVVGTMLAASFDIRAEEAAQDGVFIHVSHGSDDAHRLLMALTMATVMAPDHDVLMYFDITGVEALVKGADDIAFAQYPTLKQQLQTVLDQGVILMACPSCLEAAGKTEADLIDGAKIANKAAFFNFTKGRILSLDY